MGYDYGYWTSTTKTSTLLDELTINVGASEFASLDYTYDKNGNIIEIYDGTYTTSYYYDDLNQLVRVDDPREGVIRMYYYDLGGNITNKSEYWYSFYEPTDNDLISSVDYTYSSSDWGDLLTKWGNKTITSDAMGNMLSDGTWSYTWQHGHQLKNMTNGSTTVSFEYDASDMRTKKTVGNTVWKYTYNGSNLTHMTDGTNNYYFSYDSTGPLSVSYNGVEYYYVQNIQGDVIALVNSSGATVVTYAYDPWGKLLYTNGSMASTLGPLVRRIR